MKLADFVERPELLALLLVAPFVAGLLAWHARRRVRARLDELGPRAAALLRGASLRGEVWRRRLFAAGLLALLCALLRPTWGEDERPLLRRGADLVVCLDVSRSMLARDLLPSRLARAKQDALALAQRVEGDRLALIAFAGEARVVVPLTEDWASFAALLAPLDELAVPRGGTDLSAALAAARQALAGARGDGAAVLLLTDGEDQGGRGRLLAAALAEEDVPVHCVAYGTSGGSKIVVQGEQGQEFLRDDAGREVVTFLDEASLRALARSAGGEFLDAARRDAPLVELYEQRILPQSAEIRAQDARRERRQRFQWPLVLALLLWLGELALGEGRRATRDATQSAARRGAAAPSPARLGFAAAVALVLLLGLGGCSRPGDEALRAFRAGEPGQAAALYAEAARDAGERASARLHYNHALAAHAAGEWRAAEDALARAEQARGAHELLPWLVFLRGNLQWQRGELAAAQAAGAEAEPFAWDVAIRHIERARDAWTAALAERSGDWPAAERNVARAERRLAELEHARREAAGHRVQPEAEPRVVPLPLPLAGEDEEEEQQDAEAGQLQALSAEAVARLLEVLDGKEREKLALRRAARSAAQIGVERDW